MSKQFRGDQIARMGCAVDTPKSARGAHANCRWIAARNKFLARSGFAGDQNGCVCGSHRRHKREYFLQGRQNFRRSRRTIAPLSISSGRATLSCLSLSSDWLWIRDDYCDASHELPPDLESLHLVRSLCSLRALWSLSRLRTTPIGVADSQLIRGRPVPISRREKYFFWVIED